MYYFILFNMYNSAKTVVPCPREQHTNVDKHHERNDPVRGDGVVLTVNKKARPVTIQQSFTACNNSGLRCLPNFGYGFQYFPNFRFDLRH